MSWPAKTAAEVRPSPDGALVLVGGDHPYAQWGGNGLGQMYADNGIKSYLAINTDSASNTETPGQAGMLSWANLKSLVDTGAEIIGHGHRHPSCWERWNSGARIQYAGAAGSATVAITGTTLTLVGLGGAENAVITLATAATLAGLQAAINATTNWTCVLAAELAGDEPAASLMPLIAARDVKASVANQYFCAAGGLVVSVNSMTAQTAHISYDGTNFSVALNGVVVGMCNTTTTSYNTLAKVVTYLNGLAISNIRAALCDNDIAGQARANYVQGDELSTSLETFSYRSLDRLGGVQVAGGNLTQLGCRVCIGLSNDYIIRRNLALNKSTAAASGVTMKHFAQSGLGSSDRHFINDPSFQSYRLDGYDRGLAPRCSWVDCGHPATHSHRVINSDYNLARTKALIDAAADSPGSIINMLMHAVLPDGTSSYTFPAAAFGYYDQLEADWVPAVQYLGQATAAASILQVTPDQLFKLRPLMNKPRNYVFNPKFRNSGEAMLTGQTGTLLYGVIVPGWDVNFTGVVNAVAPAGDGITPTYGALTFSTNATTLQRVLTHQVPLKPGKTYEIGVDIRIDTLTAGSGVRVSLTPMNGPLPDFPVLNPIAMASSYGKKNGRLSMFVSSPGDNRPNKAIIFSRNNGPFTITAGVNDALSINIDSLGAVAVTFAAGSLSAYQAATAINNAIQAAGSYWSRPERWNVATAARQRLMIEGPELLGDVTYQYIQVSGNAAMTVFGASTCVAFHDAATRMNALSQWANFNIDSAMTGQFTVRFPFCREVDNFY